ncbi:MAG: ATP-binding protein [Streptosporangiaceae bacterium]|nr:ATP-binding protein [Streptosporangiaceae bacterium]MBV9855832.1 ATP-binding protein [Streptosporangiaceae bacterium]
MTTYGGSRVRVQPTWAAVGSMIVQVGGDLYVSDPGLPVQRTDPRQCPYPGLEAFRSGRAGLFFGRERLTAELLGRLDESVSSGGPVLLAGPSGAGKSSLLGAGLMTALEQGRFPVTGSDTWPRLAFTPGARPLEMLAGSLATCADALVGWEVPGPGTGGWGAAFTALRAALRERRPGARRVVIVVDQLEEIFTACGDDAERREFLDALCAIADGGNGPAGLVVLAMGADFYARAIEYPVLRPALQGSQVVIGAMTAAEVRQAIVGPAEAAGLRLEDGLTERLMRDLGAGLGAGAGGAAYEPGRLPLLAHALRATWQRRDGDRLTIAGYEAAGGVDGAIAKTAEDVYASLGTAARRAARQMFLGLVQVAESRAGDEGLAGARRRATRKSLAEADPAAAGALDAFAAAGLVVSSGPAVEITQEALLGHWPRLHDWIGQEQAARLLRQNLRDAAGPDQSPVARDFQAAAARLYRPGIAWRNAVIAVLAALSVVLAVLAALTA